MKKSLTLLGAIALTCSGAIASAQPMPPPAVGGTPPTQMPAFGAPAPVPGTEGIITSPNAAVADQVFIANLTGFAEVPPRETDATGAVAVTLNPDGVSLHYRLAVANIEDVVAAHLHIGLPDENGPIVVPLLGQGAPGDAATPPASGPANGVIAEGDLSATNLTGPLANTPLVVLMELMRSGAIYANVHTSLFPPGEIRGQVEGVGPTAAAFELLQGMPGAGTDGGTAGGAGGSGSGADGGTTGGGSGTGAGGATPSPTTPVLPST